MAALVAVAATLISWFVTADQEKDAKRRDIQIAHQIECYRTLAKVAARAGRLDLADFESLSLALAEVQLLGSPEAVKDAVAVVERIKTAGQHAQAGGGTVDLEGLARRLRDDLRKDLALPPVRMPFRVITVTPQTATHSAP